MTAGFGTDSREAIDLPEVMRGLAQRGIRVPEASVIAAIEFASSPEYDNLPASERWCQKIFWDPKDKTICAL